MGKSRRRHSRSRSRSRSSQLDAFRETFDRRLSRLEQLMTNLCQHGGANTTSRGRPSKRVTRRSRSRSSPRSRSPTQRRPKRTSVSPSGRHSAPRNQSPFVGPQPGTTTPPQAHFRRSQSPPESFIDIKDSAGPSRAGRTSPQDDSSVLLLDTDDIPESFLQAVGVDPHSRENLGQTIHPDLVATWTELLYQGWNKDDRDKMLSLYQPDPSLDLKAPALNTEIANVLTANNRSKDVRLMTAQQHLLSVLTAQACALRSTASLAGANQPDREAIGTILANSAKIVCGVFHSLSLARRDGLYPFLSSTFKDVTSKVPAKSFLFGENLGDEIKKQRSIELVSKDIRARQPTRFRQSTQQAQVPLNRKGPVRPKRGGARPAGQPPRATTIKDPASTRETTYRPRRR